jgi:hypothetical protein
MQHKTLLRLACELVEQCLSKLFFGLRKICHLGRLALTKAANLSPRISVVALRAATLILGL